MAAFDEQEFARLDAEVVRIKITLPREFELDSEASWLGVEIASSAGSHASRFDLDQERTQATKASPGIFSADIVATEYVLRLRDSSKGSFRELQEFVGKGRAQDVAIRVVPRLARYPDDARSVTVWIELQLSEREGYFTLVDGATLSLDKLRGQRAGSAEVDAGRAA